jgi:hypothetical protein
MQGLDLVLLDLVWFKCVFDHVRFFLQIVPEPADVRFFQVLV